MQALNALLKVSRVLVDHEAQAWEAPEPRRRCSPGWARLIAEVYQVDPLVCTRCGKRMKPPPPVREILRVAERGDGWGVPADWE